ncbi:MAG: baseplate J/gp47 family protein [Acidobacteriota bacterium]
MQQIIQLKPNDDIAAIRACIEMAELSHVVLVVPRGCVALESDHGLQLLRRAAEDTGVEIALVAHDYGIRDRAGAFGFPLFPSIAQAQRAEWHMTPLYPETVQGAPRGGPAPRFLQMGFSPADRMGQWWALVAVAVIASLVLCAVAAVVVPTANVRLAPSSIAMSVTTDILADPSIAQTNPDTRSIPARKITREISGTMDLKTTTQKSVPNAPSTGSVIFSNVRGEQLSIPQGTIVKTSAGVPIRFTTTTTVTLPAGQNSRVEAPIQAVDPGPTGNVKELAINTIEGTLSLESRVINLKPTASGSLKPVKVVTADDKKKLEAQLLQQLRQQGNAFLQASLKPNEIMPIESVLLDVGDEVYDHVVDDPADVLNMRISATVFGLAIDKADTQGLIGSLLKKQMQAGYAILPEGIQTETQPGGKYQGIALRLPLKGVGYASPQIDTAKVALALQGKTADEAASYLAGAIPLARPAEISITPFGWNRMPWLGFRIAVFVEPQVVNKK